jgi:hypothetical protein
MGQSVLSIAVCDRCNRKVPYTELRADPNFPGLRVCRDDVDQYDPWRLPAIQTEVITLRHPRPDQSVALNPNNITTEIGIEMSLDPNPLIPVDQQQGVETQIGEIAK